ncbi:MAG: right-handed parallel beta-helix repeat-containing protein [Anaerolineales bacterium]
MQRYRRLVIAILMGCAVSIASTWIAGTKATRGSSIVISTDVPLDDHALFLPMVAKKYAVQHRWGDWVVTGSEMVENTAIYMHGNIIVENGGSLTLRNVVLSMDCNYPGEYGIFAKPGSSLSIYDSTIKPTVQNDTFTFKADNAQLVLKDSDIRDVGQPLGNPWQVQDSPREGLWISTVGAIIEGNTIHHTESSGIRLQEGGDALITDNEIVFEGWGESRGGIDIDHSHGNTITGNSIRKQIHPITLDGSWNNLVAENEITLKSHSTGIVVQEGSGNNIIANNTLGVDPAEEWA